MANFVVKYNDAWFRDTLDGGNGVREDLRPRAERVADAIRQSAPVDTGAYRDSVTVEEDHTDRIVFRIGAAVPYAFIVEAAHGTAARALDAGR